MALLPMGLLVPVAHADISPATNTLTIEAGGTGTEEKTVTVPRLPAKADIQIAIDTTGSMFGAINQAKAQATDLVNTISAAVPDANFSVVDFRDSTDGPLEYVIKAPITNDAAVVQAAINTMSPGGGGDYPEAQNLVLSRAATDDPALWRADSRKFVVLITDAPPHGAATNGFPSCGDTSPDPRGLATNTVVADLAAAQRTLFAVTASSSMAGCYSDIAAASLPGSVSQPLGGDLASQILTLIEAASATVSDVHLEVVGPNPDASWISFSPAAAGPVETPATLPFTVNIAVPADATEGDHVFDIVALADGGDIGHQSLTITVPPRNTAPVCTAVTATPTSIWPPNHKLVNISLAGVTDPDGDPVKLTVTGVTQDEPLNGPGDGDASPDAVISTDGSSLQVRAERSGTGDGRVYTIAFTGTDTNGGTCSGTTTVGVPLDQRGAAAVDSGTSYNSLG
ncbi:VWA domain-containing protein (plasmid) [Arthrobacter agilis]|uniref:vWA domain-containing protein n=1 Tax=Arthrobacter agilis TaxID=37921 RepID=UPI0023652869|nr:vWA domain-containing protein [Arthrobacter agilis]WDF35275.1 VWA domain-containing protein [Arthrobacter agilis]